MATHDYVLANQSGSSFRTDLNNALEAIVSQNSSSTAPSTTFAYQYWVDTNTTPAKLKQRNGDNNAWITLGEIGGQVLLVDGTDTKPGVAFAADTNTGLRRDSDDAVSIVTGGTKKLSVKSDGDVGIGTETPESTLHVVGSTTLESDTSSLTISNTTTPVGYLSGNSSNQFEINASTAASTMLLQTGGNDRIRLTQNTVRFYGNSGSTSYIFYKSGQSSIAGYLSFQNITTSRTYSFPDAGGTVALTSNIPNVMTTIAGKSVGAVGTYAFLTLRNNTGNVSSGDNKSGSNLRYSNAAGNVGTGSPNGTWKCMGRLAGDEGNSEAKETSLWLRTV